MVNKKNRAGAIAIYDTIKEQNNGIIDGTLDDCVFLLYKINRLDGVDCEPQEFVKILVHEMRKMGIDQYYSP